MAQQRIDIIIRVINKATEGLQKATNGIKKVKSITDAVNKSLAKRGGWDSAANSIRNGIVKQIEIARKKATSFSTVIRKSIKKSLDTASKSARTFRANLLGAGLSLLFSGMALKRVADSALRSIVTTYKEAVRENNAFVNSTSRLGAAWTFFKFQLMDALAGSTLFQSLIEMVISFIDWISGAPQWVRKIIIFFIILGVILGGIMMVVGQLLLFALGILLLIELGILPFVIIVAIIIAIIILIVLFWDEIKAGLSWTWDKIKQFFSWLWDKIKAFGRWIADVAKKAWEKIKELTASIRESFRDAWDGVKSTFKKVWDWITGKIDAVIGKLKKWGDKLKSFLRDEKSSNVEISKNTKSSFQYVPKFQHGGAVPSTGPAILHAGEFVLSKKMLDNGVGGVNVGDINISISGETGDSERLAEIVSEKILDEFQRYAHPGGL